MFSLIYSFGYAIVVNFKKINFRADLTRDILVDPSTASMVQSGKLSFENMAIHIEGKYTIDLEAKGLQLTIGGKQLILKNLLQTKVHLAESDVKTDMSKIFFDSRKGETEVRFIGESSLFPEADFFGVTIVGPIKLTYGPIVGEFAMPGSASFSTIFGSPKVQLTEFLKNNVSIHGKILPFDDPSANIVIMPFNDFQLLYTNADGLIQMSPLFKGQFMRMVNFHLLTSAPWIDSKFEGIATNMISSNIPTSSKVIIKTMEVEKITLKDFKGRYQLGDGHEPSINQDLYNNWSISPSDVAELVIIFQAGKDNSTINCRLNIDAEIENFKIGNFQLKSFRTNFIKAVSGLWVNPFFLGVILIILTFLITDLVQKNR